MPFPQPRSHRVVPPGRTMRRVLSWLAIVTILPHAQPARAQTWRHLAAPDTATHTEFERVVERSVDGTMTRETAFRIRTETVHLQPRVDDAIEAFRPRWATETPADRGIRESLDRVVPDVAFDETPLRDAVAQIGLSLRIPVRLHTRALDDAGLDAHEPVSLDVNGLRGHAALAHLLDDLDLTFCVRHEALVITTRDDAEQNPVVAEYPLPLGDDIDGLVTMIQQTVAPTTWNTVGGSGSIQPDRYGTRLFVSQTEEVHREIAALLVGLLDPDPQPAIGTAEAAAPEPRGRSVRVYHVPLQTQRDYLSEHLPSLCNEALADHADPDAVVTLIDEELIVQSRSAIFHCYAAQVVRAIVGVQVATVEAVGNGDPMPGMGGAAF